MPTIFWGADSGSGVGVGPPVLMWFLVGVGVLAGIALTVLLWTRARHLARAVGQVSRKGASGSVDAVTAMDRRASAALVTLDDALRASEQELGFALAQFGEASTRAFAAVLVAGRAAATQAFGLRQRLDDAEPETEVERTAMQRQILELCARADSALDQQTVAFDDLRDLHRRAPELLDETDRRATDSSVKVAASEVTLRRLGSAYAGSSLASVVANPEHAGALFAGAHEAVALGRAALGAGDRSAAVEAARTAESAVALALSLLDAVGRAEVELAGASDVIAAGVISLAADLDDAARLSAGDPVVGVAATKATSALAAARAVGSGSDPLAVMRELRIAEAALDKALEPARAEAERIERARTQLTNAVGPLQSRVRAVADFIETRRGAVGPEARTRMAEAQRLLAEAESLVDTSPDRGLRSERRAERLVGEAQSLAQQDVEAFERSRSGGTGGRVSGTNLGGLVLGGVLVDGLLRGGRRGGFGGGWGGC